MLTWLAARWIDILLVLAVLAAVTLAVMKILKDKKAGKSSCGCSCGGCPMAGKCKGAADAKPHK
ncbi:MAG: FeoB-associated Cys-rich membrane protein [Clostridiales bacterium]|nr:FeoB-associated Cys-rich membrane protein [Clostridiales bacterium]MBR5357891.1 FeoB-associated Cys-rich membrane protein [Clostridiales bacterium]